MLEEARMGFNELWVFPRSRKVYEIEHPIEFCDDFIK